MRTPSAGLVGRSTERTQLAAALSLAVTAVPQLVVMEGDPGIGKTALLDDLAAEVGGAPGRTVMLTRVACDERERLMGYGLAGLILGEVVDPAESVLSVAKRLLRWFGQQQTEDVTAVVLIDDAQWMDVGSADALRFALRRLRSDRILAVVARRPPTSGDDWATLLSDRVLTRMVRPQPLSSVDVLELLVQRPIGRRDAAAAADILRVTGGVPLLVQSELAVPSTLGTAVSASSAVRQMMRGMPAEAVDLVEALAVWAEPASPSLLAAVAGTDRTFAALGDAVAATMVMVASTGVVEFSHALLRTAVYGQIPLPRQRELHGRAAAASTGVRQLEHRVAAAARPDQSLTDELVAAAAATRRENRPGQAAHLLLMAASVAPGADEREWMMLQALCDRLEAFDLTGAAELEVQARAARDSPLRSYTLGLIARDRGDTAAADALLRSAVDAATADTDHDLAVTAAIELSRMHASLNNGGDVLRAVASVDDLPQALPAEVQVRLTTMTAVGEWESGRIERAIQILDGLTPPERGTAADADRFAARGMIRYFHGDLAASIQDLDYAISLSHLWRPSVMLDRAHVQRSLSHYLAGDWDAAAVDAATACTVADTDERPWIVALAHAMAAMVPANRGQWDIAETHLQEAVRANRRIRSAQGDGLTASAAAQISLVRGDFEQVLHVVAPALRTEVLTKLQAVRSYRWLMIVAITALTELNRFDEAQQQLHAYSDMVRRWPQAPGPARLGWLAGRLAQARGDASAAAAAYDTDLADPQMSRSPFTLAEVLYSSGALERRVGHRREGIDRLTRARSIFLRLRATPFVVGCDTELSGAGLRQPSSPTLGLTEREQDVAVLVAKGMTNNEIAAELYLTSKTIEYHLGNIYSKLAISGRRELRRRLAGS